MTAPHRKSRIAAGAVLFLLAACRSDDAGPDYRQPVEQGATVVSLDVAIRASTPHDPDAFTQGLEYVDDHLYESTGRYGQSELREVAPETGHVIREASLEPDVFGEGLTHVDGRLIQLTWKAGRALVYDVDTLALLDAFDYEGEGWGLCFDGDQLVMSDGSSSLSFRDPEDFRVSRTVSITNEMAPIAGINELECVDGAVYANVWRTDQIIRIDPTTGAVDAVIDASSLPRPGEAGVLNGIAHDPDTGLFRLTGKNWPTSYDVEFVPAD